MDRSSYHTEGNPLVNYLSLSFLNQCGKSGVSTNELGLIAGEPLAALQGTAVPAACFSGVWVHLGTLPWVSWKGKGWDVSRVCTGSVTIRALQRTGLVKMVKNKSVLLDPCLY